MSEILFRVARALCEERTWPGAWERANEAEKSAWLRDATAAISAMRDPTDFQCQAGYYAMFPAGRADNLRELWLLRTKHVWQAMIDEVLK